MFMNRFAGMNHETLQAIVDELNQSLPGRFMGRVYQLSPLSFAIDVGIRREGHLFISVEPEAPRLYLIKRSSKELEKSSTPLNPFAQAMRNNFGGGEVQSVSKDQNERVVRIQLRIKDDLGDPRRAVLVAQLTGRSANLFILDDQNVIVHVARVAQADGQTIGSAYQPPSGSGRVVESGLIRLGEFQTASEAADHYYRQDEAMRVFSARAAMLATKLRKETSKLKKLKANLEQDLKQHGNPEEHKRTGDLFLANIAGAHRTGDTVTLQDYYAEGMPSIEMNLDSNISLQEAAASSFSRYSKAKRAIEELSGRLAEIDQQLGKLEKKQAKLTEAIETRDETALAEFEERKKEPGPAKKKAAASKGLPGMRRYLSSDGYEVILGRTARDNDKLTFREARPNDLWLHAGDYPGSHVIVRNLSRKEIPHRTILEAAQLAAKFSQASKDAKVNIHYTRRKFISKPKGAAPGLVRLSNFRSITVEPGENIERI
jgi:predicted ribosome quality control (RQC) complex YloA/Tae2 family protein